MLLFFHPRLSNISYFQKRIPDDPVPDHVIKRLLNDLADMDTNTFSSNCGAGNEKAGYSVSW